MATKQTKITIAVILISICICAWIADRSVRNWRRHYESSISMWQSIENDDTVGIESALKHGADANAFGDAGLGERHSLITAQSKNSPELVSRLLAVGADPTVALHRAISAGEAKRLIGIGAKVDGNSKDGGLTPLSEQSANGRADVVEVLLSNGANPSYKDKDGYTPRQRALYALGNHPEASAEYSRTIKLLDQSIQAHQQPTPR